MRALEIASAPDTMGSTPGRRGKRTDVGSKEVAGPEVSFSLCQVVGRGQEGIRGAILRNSVSFFPGFNPRGVATGKSGWWFFCLNSLP